MHRYEILCQVIHGTELIIGHHECPHRSVLVIVENEVAFAEAIKDPMSQEVQGSVLSEATKTPLFRLTGVRRGLSGRCLALICEDVRTKDFFVLYTNVAVDGATRDEILRAAANEMKNSRITETETYWDNLIRRRDSIF